MKKLILFILCFMSLFMANALALTDVSYTGDDDDKDLYLRFQKGHYDAATETRAFGDLKKDPPYLPHEGHVRVPIIMVEFPDLPFTFSQAQLQEQFVGKHPVEERPVAPSSSAGYGYGSAQEFFYENSFGKLDLEFEFYGPYTLPQNHSYYGHKNSMYLSMKNLLEHTLPIVDDDIDFARYDNDGDSICEIVYLLFAGEGADITYKTSDIWPVCGLVNEHLSNEGIKLRRIGTNSELLLAKGNALSRDGSAIINGIGVFCHELSHGLGLPDLYNSGDGNWPDFDNNGPEDWDLMDNGAHLRNSFWPTPYTAWERMIMGWMEAEELTSEQDVTIWPLNDEAGRGKAYVVRNPANHDEFWTIENIPSDGWYAGLFGGGTGIIIMHIDYADELFEFNKSPNNVFGRPSCTIIPADGRIISSYYVNSNHPDGTEVTSIVYWDNLRGDPYPGSTGTTALAAYHNYAGEEDLVKTMPITNIHLNADGSVSFHFGGNPADIKDLRSEGEDGPMYDLFGNKLSAGSHGIVIQNGRKKVI